MDTEHTNKFSIAGGKNTIIIIVDEGRKRRIQQQNGEK